ncbi:hypothetical protein FNV43_RR26942 [Rhamnella rubrinervis]|uniref:Plastid movement impaired protein n=1 Tax=Rhamnella rubrinervis TaxID=2594499 RepID=A0A8K0DNI6_9ROSA|nr:hypothetical protein FNV43_RR26942 [Rhamnella rubrinervis]
MGNTLGGKKTTKVMKINGETFKLKTPIQAGEVLRDYPAGYVLLESESVKHYGTRAKPLEAHQELQPKRLYFLVELPKVKKEIVPRRVRSGINMSAKDRLENLMLARRSVSDLSVMKPTYIEHEESKEESVNGGGGGVRVRMRLPKAEVEKLMKESRDEEDAAEKIMELCLANTNSNNGGRQSAENKVDKGAGLNQHVHWNDGGHGRVRDHGVKVMF